MNDNARGPNQPTGQSTDEQTGGSIPRRTFLGATAAVATLPVTATAQEESKQPIASDGIDESPDVRRIPAGRHKELWSSVDMGEVTDEETELNVTGYWYADEEGGVEVSISTRPAHFHVHMSSERAREIGESFLQAAAEVERDQ